MQLPAYGSSGTIRGVGWPAAIVAALSLATDLGLGLPQEHVVRQTTIAARLAALAGLSDTQQVAVYYTSLLAWALRTSARAIAGRCGT